MMKQVGGRLPLISKRVNVALGPSPHLAYEGGDPSHQLAREDLERSCFLFRAPTYIPGLVPAEFYPLPPALKSTRKSQLKSTRSFEFELLSTLAKDSNNLVNWV